MNLQSRPLCKGNSYTNGMHNMSLSKEQLPEIMTFEKWAYVNSSLCKKHLEQYSPYTDAKWWWHNMAIGGVLRRLNQNGGCSMQITLFLFFLHPSTFWPDPIHPEVAPDSLKPQVLGASKEVIHARVLRE
jgi:hypothetical protein